MLQMGWILAAGFAVVAGAVQVGHWIRLGSGSSRPHVEVRRLQVRAAVSCVLFLVAGGSYAIAAYLRAEPADDGDVNEYQACIDEQERLHGERSGGVSEIAERFCEEHRRCRDLEGARDDGSRLLTPEDWCDVLD